MFKKLFNKFFSKKNECDCQRINLDTKKKGDRVKLINEAAPGCKCEARKMSEYSPSIIDDKELISRFVFSPMHINAKTGEIKPSIISHVFNRGCSIQRETIAPDTEISNFISSFLSQDADKRSWNKVLIAKCSQLRSILIDDKRILCVYDTAERENPAHGEMCLAREIPEADQPALRYEIMQAFSQTELPSDYRNGLIQNNLCRKSNNTA